MENADQLDNNDLLPQTSAQVMSVPSTNSFHTAPASDPAGDALRKIRNDAQESGMRRYRKDKRSNDVPTIDELRSDARDEGLDYTEAHPEVKSVRGLETTKIIDAYEDAFLDGYRSFGKITDDTSYFPGPFQRTIQKRAKEDRMEDMRKGLALSRAQAGYQAIARGTEHGWLKSASSTDPVQAMDEIASFYVPAYLESPVIIERKEPEASNRFPSFRQQQQY